MRKLMKMAFWMVSILIILQLAGCTGATNDTGVNKHSEPQEKSLQIDAKTATKAVVPAETKKTIKTETPGIKKKIDSPITNSNSVVKKEVSKKTLVHPNNAFQSKMENKKSPAVLKPQAQTKTETQAQVNTKTHTQSKPANKIHSVSFSIAGPKNQGIIMKKTNVIFKKGDTILKVLLQATEKRHIQVDYSGSGAMAYVNGIDNIYEFDYGAKSGWVCKQNGKSLTKSVDAILVKDGDQIEFYYTQ
ncbi:MAG: DUF4430 domain-containing protein [Bacillota bacterium]|nr:DUF4430 domain-containing protein [Bacillota bacterium]